MVEVAKHLGIAYYGPAGDEKPQVPQDAYDLDVCNSAVNNAIRMFIADAPPAGWRWMQPILSMTVWPSVSVETAATIAWAAATAYAIGSKVTNGGESYVCLVAHTSGVFAADLATAYWRETYDCTGVNNPADDRTVVTASGASFYPSMEQKTLTITGVGSYTIEKYTSSTVVEIAEQHAWVGAKTFSIAADGDYTLPQTFGGSYSGPPAFAAGTNTGVKVQWTSPNGIRRLRESVAVVSGDPYFLAVRPLSSGTRRRWELLTYPIPSSVRVVEFQYLLHFNNLTDADDLHPAGFEFDYTLVSACKAMADRDNRDLPTAQSEYRQIDLVNAYKINDRSAPKRLGYCGPGRRTAGRNITAFREGTERRTVTFS